MALSLRQLAELIGARVEGDGEVHVTGLATLASAGEGQVSFLANRAYRRQLATTRASAVIVSSADAPACPTNALVMDDPYVGYARAAAALSPAPSFPGGRHEGAWVDPSAVVGAATWVGAGAVVEAGAHIGDRCFVGPGCVVAAGAAVGPDSRLVANVYLGPRTRVGARALLQPGAVLGADGFGFADDGERWQKIPQLGRVVVGDDVEIGANSAVDRGALEDTVLGNGVKLDNLVQIGHNVTIGDHTIVAGASAVAGSTRIGRRCALGGNVRVLGHIELVDGVMVTACSTIHHSIRRPGVYSSGVMEQDNSSWRRNALRFRQLEEMMKRIRMLERRLEGRE